MEDSKFIRMLWLVLVLFVAFIVWKLYSDKREFFANASDITQDVIDLYYKILQRAPNSTELKKYVQALKAEEYDMREIELRLINSDEYQRLIKTQTNMILPETKRMIEEKDVITLIKNVYFKIRGKKLNKDLYLPYRDLYIYFDYNLYKFVAMLRDSKYLEFESEVLKDSKLSRESLIDLYHATFDDAKLNYAAEALEKMDKSLSKGKRLIDLVQAKDGEPIRPEDLNTQALLDFLMKDAKNIQKKEEAGAALVQKPAPPTKQLYLTTDQRCTASQRLYLPDEAKILTTAGGVSVPEKHPPVCIPVGKPNEPGAVMFGNFQGTPLDQAEDTQVGSIMPKFEYRRYIEIPVAGTTVPPKKEAFAEKELRYKDGGLELTQAATAKPAPPIKWDSPKQVPDDATLERLRNKLTAWAKNIKV
jgi:hypothetical protein